MKFNFRKIASALASTAMLGSTVGIAMAANFPAPFVANGAADVAIVYGNSLDLSAVTEISTALSAELASGSTAAAATDDAYALFTGSTPLQLNNSINSVRTSVTETNLPVALADSDFSGNVDADVTFQVQPGSNPRTIFAKEPTSSDDPGIGILLSTTAGNYFYNATATFSKAVNFSHVDSEGESVTLFGKDFTVASATDVDTLVLFQSAQTIFLSVGGTSATPSTTTTVGDETYTIELIAASDTSATVKVTDSSGATDQKEINEAASKKILGLEVAVNTADESTATNTLTAEIIVGANKLTFEDATEVTVGSDATPIRGTKVDFNDGLPTNLTKLTVQVFAGEGSEDYVKAGDAFADPVFGGFRFVLTGLTSNEAEDREDFKIDSSGGDKMTISLSNWQDKALSNFVWVNNESNSWGKSFLGDTNDWQIFVSESAKINESAYAVVGNEDDGYLVRLKTLTNSTGSPIYTSDAVTFENVFDTTQTWSATISAEGTGTIDIGGKSYAVIYHDDGSDNVDGDQYVQLNYQDSTGTDMIAFPSIETGKGAKMIFYQPLFINLTDANLAGTGWNNISNIKIPDGDGYSNIVITPDNRIGVAGGLGNNNYTITVGAGSATVVTTNDTSSADGLIGALRWNVTSGAQAVADSKGLSGFAPTNGTLQIGLYLEDPSDGTIIERPAVIFLEEKDEGSVYNAVIVETGGAGTSSSGTGVSDVDFTWDGDSDMGTGTTAWGAAGVQMESNDDLYQMMDQWGALVTTDESDSDQFSSVISYPDDQVTALLYVDQVAAGGSTTLGDVKVMDDELASSGMSGKNLIVVGGSCVNTAASTLLGGTAGCGSSWTAATSATTGEWIIQTFANPWGPTKVATLVAGWEQGNTADAATYLTTQANVDMSVGKKLTGTTATAATPVVV